MQINYIISHINALKKHRQPAPMRVFQDQPGLSGCATSRSMAPPGIPYLALSVSCVLSMYASMYATRVYLYYHSVMHNVQYSRVCSSRTRALITGLQTLRVRMIPWIVS
jgi:hypothetical protein